MNKFHTSIILLIVLLASSNLLAGESEIQTNNISYDQIEKTLTQGVNSDNFGLKVSSTYMLGEIKSENSVNLLTKMLRESDNEKLRLVAALSLLKIGTDRSIYMVKKSRVFNSNENVRNLCDHLYNCHLYKKYCESKEGKQALMAYLFEPNN